MRVNELAKTLNTTADTVRYYTRLGLLVPSKDSQNGYKEYSSKDRQRLRFILGARQLGFSVSDVRQIINEAQSGRTACPLARKLIEQRMAETEQQFQHMLRLRNRMQSVVELWQAKPDKAPSAHLVCHLIEDAIGSEEPETLI